MSHSLVSPGQFSLPVQQDGPGPDQWGSWYDDKYYSLQVVQHPMRARMCGFGDKDRRPLAPAAIAKLILTSRNGSEVDVDDIAYDFLVVTADLWSEDGRSENNLVIHQAYLESRANRASSSVVQQTPNPSGISPGVPGESPPESQSAFQWPNTNPQPFPVHQTQPSPPSVPSSYPSTWANPQSQSRAIPLNAPTATADRYRTSSGAYTAPSSIHGPSNINTTQNPALNFSSNAAERGAGTSSNNGNGRQGSDIPMLPGIRETFFLQSTPGYQAHHGNTATAPTPAPWSPIGMGTSATPILGSSSMTTIATSPTATTNPSSWPPTTAYTSSHAAGASGALTSHTGISGNGSGFGPGALPSTSPPSGVGSGSSHHTPHQAVHAHNTGSSSLSTGSGYGSGPSGVVHHASQESTSSSTSSSSIGGTSRPPALPPPMRSPAMQMIATTTPPSGSGTPSSANATGSAAVGISGSGSRPPKYTRMLIGPVAAGAALLRDENDLKGIFFIFQDLSVRTEGKFRLRLRLSNVGTPGFPHVNQNISPVLAQAYTEAFEVFTAKRFPGVPPITSLSAALGRQGQKLPLRTKSDVHTSAGPSSRSRRKGHRVGKGSGDDYSGEDNDHDHDGGGGSEGDD